MIILTSANPITTREVATKHEKRSLFRDVIESLRIRSQIPENFKQHDDNNLSHNYDRYGYENEPLQLPSDADFIPRRNDRIEMPPLKYRFPKSLDLNDTDQNSNGPPKEEVVIYIDTHETSPAPKPTTTQKPPKKRPQVNKNKQNKNKESEELPSTEIYRPLTNNMNGLSQIGDRESQTVVKPTVIVNIRGSVSHHDSEIRLEKNSHNDTLDIPRNVFNINQEVNLDREPGKRPNKIKQDIKLAARENGNIEEDMMMCETSHKTSGKQNEDQNRKFENVLQILFSI